MLSLLAAITMIQKSDNAPAPVGALPSPRQLAWHDQEYYAFVHFGPNTFTAKEWGDGLEDPKIFNPTELNTDQWCKVFKEAGMTGVIITAKHHDGFCLWPSNFSKHTVAQSDWQNGTGDVLKQLSASCKKYGLKMGVYVSPWDRNHPSYGTEEYNQIYANTLQEVLTKYGNIFEVWFDGANGEGPNGKKQVYDWPLFHQTVRKHQPEAVMFSDAGPDIRWVGNEGGYSDPTCWATLNRDKYKPGTPLFKELTQGQEGGTHWVPAECDVSIRPGWFWRETENDKVKSGEELFTLYLRSVGQNANFLLNVPPDKRGLIHENDIKSLMRFKELRDLYFSNLISEKATYSASETRNNSPRFDADATRSDSRNEYWATNDNTKQAWLTMEWDEPATFQTILIREPIQLGQRVKEFVIEFWNEEESDWQELIQGTTIGNKRLFHIFPLVTIKLRIVVKDSRACPAISTFAVYSSQTF